MSDARPPHFEQFVKTFGDAASDGRIVVLTGAGVSAESGIPTFRGPEGFWTVGSQVHQPQELATRTFFRRQPEIVWGWYLYRWSLCRDAAPNAAHLALAEMSRLLAGRFTLVTQNVDGLHRHAGSAEENTFEIHGNLDWMRCSAACSRALLAMPPQFMGWERHRLPGEAECRQLHCQDCGAWMRPHVLWFDESYEEEFFRSESSMASVASADLLLVIGTSGATSLPMHMAQLAQQRGIPLLSIDPNETAFAVAQSANQLRATATSVLPGLLQALTHV